MATARRALRITDPLTRGPDVAAPQRATNRQLQAGGEPTIDVDSTHSKGAARGARRGWLLGARDAVVRLIPGGGLPWADERPPRWPREKCIAALLVCTALMVLPSVASAGVLTVAVDPSGTVTSQPAGISCPGACSTQFADGAQVTLTVTPAAGYAFGDPNPGGAPGNQSGWVQGCTPTQERADVCSVTIDAVNPTLVTAHFRPAAQLDVVPSGRGTITATVANPAPGEQATQSCPANGLGQAFGGVTCQFTFLQGREVTVTAQPDAPDPDPSQGGPPSSFGQWSDDRCPPAPQCTLTVDAERVSIAALFTPQLVRIRVAGTPGTVTSAPPGLTCNAAADAFTISSCDGYFPLFADVALTATGSEPRWWAAGCDAITDSTCHVAVDNARWPAVGFATDPSTSFPADVTIRLHIRKAGSGAGTVRGDSIDCGGRCSADIAYRTRRTLMAVPAAGSRFARWKGACSTEPSCSLTVGPVTAITAVFDEIREPVPPGSEKFQAKVGRPRASGAGRRRAILIPVDMNARASLRARLMRGRRQVATRVWRLSAGRHLLRMRVPRGARRGLHTLRVTVRDTSGPPQRSVHKVRLRR